MRVALFVAAAFGAVALGAANAAAADAARGADVYTRCLACHSLASDRVGPHHCGLIGRKAGSVPGFTYSEAMKKSKLTWDEKTLDRFLQNPAKMVPGTSMTYAGVPEAKDRADLIAYLQQANQSPECRNRK
jgi:cytochrome c